MTEKNGEHDDQLREILHSIPERFAIAKTGVDFSTQRAYLALAANHEHDLFSEEEVMTKGEALFNAATPVDEKKETLVLLAHTGTLDAYRVLERFAETTAPELRGWSALALEECRLLLEQGWGESVGTIMTGLGGEEGRLRYFVVVCSKEGSAALTPAQTVSIERAFLAICNRWDSVLEEVQVQAHYAILKLLVPLDVAVGEVIEGGIGECNQRAEYLDDKYYVTNVRIPTDAEIQQFLSE